MRLALYSTKFKKPKWPLSLLGGLLIWHVRYRPCGAVLQSERLQCLPQCPAPSFRARSINPAQPTGEPGCKADTVQPVWECCRVHAGNLAAALHFAMCNHFQLCPAPHGTGSIADPSNEVMPCIHLPMHQQIMMQARTTAELQATQHIQVAPFKLPLAPKPKPPSPLHTASAPCATNKEQRGKSVGFTRQMVPGHHDQRRKGHTERQVGQ